MPEANPKIIDLIKAKKAGSPPSTSLEFFPPRTDEGVKNLYARMERMLKTSNPLFTDITWGAGGSTADLSLKIALSMVETGHVSNMHLTCTNMDKDGDPIAGVHDALEAAYKGGIRNIVALRGDPPHGQETWTATEGGFSCALDLVKYIRKEYGDEFGVAVAGYPEGHPNAITELKPGEEANMTDAEKGRCSKFDGITYVCKDEDYKKEMDYLKQKVDAGSDLIITQMFFDVEVFKTFVTDCRKWGIDCPVVPGLMCLNAYGGFKKMTKFCRARVPQELNDKMDSIKDDTDALKTFGVEFGAKVCQELTNFGCEVLHFYTLNLEKVVYGITDQLGLTDSVAGKSDESDAKSMQAVGSAWARVGDKVKCTQGEGTLQEIRKDGVAVICMEKWNVAGEPAEPLVYLQAGQYEKL